MSEKNNKKEKEKEIERVGDLFLSMLEEYYGGPALVCWSSLGNKVPIQVDTDVVICTADVDFEDLAIMAFSINDNIHKLTSKYE